MAEHPQAHREGRQEHSPRGEGHPGLRDPRLHDPLAHRLHEATGHDEAGAQSSTEQIGHLSAFQEAKHQAPDHAQGQAVQHQCYRTPGGRQYGEEQEGQPGQSDEGTDGLCTLGRGHLRDHLDAQELARGIAHDLGQDVEDLEVHLGQAGQQRHALEGAHCKGLPEGVHAEVGRECRRHGPDGEQPTGPVGQPCLEWGVRAHWGVPRRGEGPV